MEDGISGGLQYRHETCCEKDGCCGRWACMVQRWFYRGDVVSRQMDLHMIRWQGVLLPILEIDVSFSQFSELLI